MGAVQGKGQEKGTWLWLQRDKHGHPSLANCGENRVHRSEIAAQQQVDCDLPTPAGKLHSSNGQGQSSAPWGTASLSSWGLESPVTSVHGPWGGAQPSASILCPVT